MNWIGCERNLLRLKQDNILVNVRKDLGHKKISFRIPDDTNPLSPPQIRSRRLPKIIMGISHCNNAFGNGALGSQRLR